MSEKPNVGFIGLGDFGGPMAQHIIDAGFPTHLWARRDASLEQYAAGSYTRAATPKELGSRCDVIGICVFTADDNREVLLGDDGVFAGMAPGGVVMLHSTIDLPACRELAAAGEARGITVTDIPLAGARPDSIAGNLVAYVGAEKETLERVRPILKSFCGAIGHMGPPGSGLIMKMINNTTSAANGRLAVLALETGHRLGLDMNAMIPMLRLGGAASKRLDRIADMLIPDPEMQAYARKVTAKDTLAFKQLLQDEGIPSFAIDQLAMEYADHVVPEVGGN